jgi:hypothetical protein
VRAPWGAVHAQSIQHGNDVAATVDKVTLFLPFPQSTSC